MGSLPNNMIAKGGGGGYMSQRALKHDHSFFGKSRENRDLNSAAKNTKCSATRVAVVVLLHRLDCPG